MIDVAGDDEITERRFALILGKLNICQFFFWWFANHEQNRSSVHFYSWWLTSYIASRNIYPLVKNKYQSKLETRLIVIGISNVLKSRSHILSNIDHKMIICIAEENTKFALSGFHVTKRVKHVRRKLSSFDKLIIEIVLKKLLYKNAF